MAIFSYIYIMNSVTDLKDVYDNRSSKFQNFAYVFNVEKDDISKKVEVWATSLIVATDHLRFAIGNSFKITEA